MTTTSLDPATLYDVRRGAVDIVDVPELEYFVVDGCGAPEDGDFGAALQALYGVSYTAHFLLKEQGEATHVGPLEALWWVDDPQQRAVVEAVAAGRASADEMDRSGWHWRAMIRQPSMMDGRLAERAIAQTGARRPSAALERVRFIRWTEGRCAQTLHIGPYSDETPTIVRLHSAIAQAGGRPRGRHHEIYLSDPRRTAPDKLRTIVRQPISGGRGQ
jgi:hypothetical protein